MSLAVTKQVTDSGFLEAAKRASHSDIITALPLVVQSGGPIGTHGRLSLYVDVPNDTNEHHFVFSINDGDFRQMASASERFSSSVLRVYKINDDQGHTDQYIYLSNDLYGNPSQTLIGPFGIMHSFASNIDLREISHEGEPHLKRKQVKKTLNTKEGINLITFSGSGFMLIMQHIHEPPSIIVVRVDVSKEGVLHGEMEKAQYIGDINLPSLVRE